MWQSRSTTRPTCQCSTFRSVAAQFGTLRYIDGHLALVPLSLNVAGVGNLRPNDPVAVSGKLARQKVCQGIRAFCTKLTVAAPDLDQFLPASLFTETGTPLKQLQNLAKHLAEYQYIRIVDKGAGEPWGFCDGFWIKSSNSCARNIFNEFAPPLRAGNGVFPR